MNARRAFKIAGIGAAGSLVVVAVATLSFCVAYRAQRRSNVVQVPDWIGRTREAAMADASRLGLLLEVSAQRHDAGVAAGRVIQHDPVAGSTVRRGRTVRVTVSLGGETLAVPDLVMMPARQSDAEVRRAGLEPGFEARIHDHQFPAGHVIAQTPAPGALSVSGERVHRLVSDGPRAPRWVIPDLTGRPLQEVRDWITLCGFRSGPVRRIPAEGKPSGTVVGQLPPAGSPITRRDVIELTVVP